MGRRVRFDEAADCPLVSGGYCFLLCPPLPLKIVRFIPPPAEAGVFSREKDKRKMLSITKKTPVSLWHRRLVGPS